MLRDVIQRICKFAVLGGMAAMVLSSILAVDDGVVPLNELRQRQGIVRVVLACGGMSSILGALILYLQDRRSGRPQ
jgi:hypothetical protein